MPHLAPTSPGTSGPAWGRPRCSSSPPGRVCRSPGRRPPGTLAAGHHSTPQGHTHPLGDGTAHRQGSPAQQSRAHVCCQPSPRGPLTPTGPGHSTHPAVMAARALGALGPRCQLASGCVAARVPTGLQGRGGSGLQGRPAPPPQEPLRVVTGLRVCSVWWPHTGQLGGHEQASMRAEGRGHLASTWGGPQSHCSPRSTNRFPHTGSPTSRLGSGALARQAVRGFSTNISRSARLHWLNILGNWALGVQGGASVRGWGGTQDTPPPQAAPGLTRCWPP